MVAPINIQHLLTQLTNVDKIQKVAEQAPMNQQQYMQVQQEAINTAKRDQVQHTSEQSNPDTVDPDAQNEQERGKNKAKKRQSGKEDEPDDSDGTGEFIDITI